MVACQDILRWRGCTQSKKDYFQPFMINKNGIHSKISDYTFSFYKEFYGEINSNTWYSVHPLWQMTRKL